MRGLYILCEGLTEEEFVNTCLRPFLHKPEYMIHGLFLCKQAQGLKVVMFHINGIREMQNFC